MLKLTNILIITNEMTKIRNHSEKEKENTGIEIVTLSGMETDPEILASKAEVVSFFMIVIILPSRSLSKNIDIMQVTNRRYEKYHNFFLCSLY